MEKRYVRPDGSVVWVYMTVASLNLSEHKENNHLCMVQDITEMIRAKEYLEQSKKRYKDLYLEYQGKQMLLKSLLNSIPDLIFYKDVHGNYMGCNKAFEKFAGLSEARIIGRTDFDLFDEKTAKLFVKMDRSMMKRKKQQKNEELVTYPDGSQVYLDTVKTPYYDHQGNLLGLIGISRDISDRKQKEEEIIYLNYHDIVTGLFNRTYFDEEQTRLDTPSNLPLSVIVGDIDGLKVINDAFGHAEGDRLLVETARTLTRCCRPEDIVARTGGDEFCILLPKADEALADAVFNRILKACEEYETKADKNVYFLNISLGYATKAEGCDAKSFDESNGFFHKLVLDYKRTTNKSTV
jgi:diguanylate cyclase (GGDEF)-like protein/PAS domain S-box-containing protein